MTTLIRNARDEDRESVVSISIRTIRASYSSFLGAEAVEGWISSGAVATYFDDNLPDCWLIEQDSAIVGFSVVRDALVDLMMIDSERHREGFGRLLLQHVEAQLFESEPALTLESFAENRIANAFYEAMGWTSGARFDHPDDGIARIIFSKQRAFGPA